MTEKVYDEGMREARREVEEVKETE